MNEAFIEYLDNYVPLPTNRKRNSKLYKIKKSDCLKTNNLVNSNERIGIKKFSNKDRIRKILDSKNLSS